MLNNNTFTSGITVETQKKKIIFYDVSVMMGTRSGVAARLRNRIGAHNITTHYVAHNLELSVTDAIYTTSLKIW